VEQRWSVGVACLRRAREARWVGTTRVGSTWETTLGCRGWPAQAPVGHSARAP
jgi:hypothetical protein